MGVNRETKPSSSTGHKAAPIPRGIEVLVKKAAVDPDFRQVLLRYRAAAADEIGLKLEPAETAMLNAVPAEQLETIIANTKVSEVSRAAFLGRAAATMLAALTATTATGCSTTTGIAPDRIPTKGVNPDRPKATQPEEETREPVSPERPNNVPITDGIRPDRPDSKEEERPSEPPVTQGIRPE